MPPLEKPLTLHDAQAHPPQFSLASILLVMFVVSLCLGALRLDPCLGVVVSAFTIPALVRTAIVAARKRARGYRLTTQGRIVEFLYSWLITFPIAIAALVTAGGGILVTFGLTESSSLEPVRPLLVPLFVIAVVLIFVFGIRMSLDFGPAKEGEAIHRRPLPRFLPASLLSEAGCYSPPMLYTPAMIAELAEVPVAAVRAWQRRGWIVPREVEHGLARFDFAEVTVARTLAGLAKAGIKPAILAKKLQEISARLPQVQRPLAELSFVVDGRKLLVRHRDELQEPRGQLRIDFEAAHDDEQPAILSPPLVLAEKILGGGQNPDDLAQHGRELEEEGDLKGAAEMYRSALAASGPRNDLCFELAEVLYRLGDLPAARERYFMAIELDEDHAEARANLGCLLAEMGEQELAAAALAGAIACHAEYADAHYHLARLLDEQGRGEDAAVHWRDFLRLAADSPWHDEARERLGQ